ncbi:hypothetical protein E3N88_07757 [Mikania micrantha]|uniref:Uncharacterized protein n=1 Tax=Mikania micrantha TaxID=192012 RepID=A0A5N6PEP0_9ASTR|nr:hypothetical protein E3N88_07757 [Mikania micrantha]
MLRSVPFLHCLLILAVIMTNFASYSSVAKTTGKEGLYCQFHVFLSALFAHLAVIITNFASYASMAKTTGKEGLYCSWEATLDHDELERQFHVFLSTLFSHLAVIITNYASYASVAKATGKEGLYCSRQYSPFRKFHFLLLIFLLLSWRSGKARIWGTEGPRFEPHSSHPSEEHGLVVENFMTTNKPHKRNRSHFANLAPYGQFHVFLSTLFAHLAAIITNFASYASVAKTTGKEGLYWLLLCTMMSWSMKNGFHDLQRAFNLAEA